jgi:hypothetical protein
LEENVLPKKQSSLKSKKFDHKRNSQLQQQQMKKQADMLCAATLKETKVAVLMIR